MDPSYSSTCELFEASLSALIDGELESPEQLPAIDHLLECASCQEFYRQARALGSMVASMAPPSTEAAPSEVWDRIATETGLAEVDPRKGSGEARRLAPWLHKRPALQLAAGLVLALGLWFLWPVVSNVPTPEPSGGTEGTRETGVVDVVLEQDRGSMSDERFLELATEILRADRGYHRKMLEIMRVVDTLAPRSEGSGDDPAVGGLEGLQRTSDSEDDSEDTVLWSGDQL